MTDDIFLRPPVAASIASTNPSPPSAIGQQSISAVGNMRFTPRAIASAAFAALSASLYESGAQITFISAVYPFSAVQLRLGGVYRARIFDPPLNTATITAMAPPPSTRLVIFADDWGRHPSSAQHLVRHLLPRVTTLWINTTGTRRPRCTPADVARGLQILHGRRTNASATPPNLTIIRPRMYPGFRTRWQRRLNAQLLAGAINKALAAYPPTAPPAQTVAITTLPITCDLVGLLAVDRWGYYCVDDFSLWPGLDGPVMAEMEREQLPKMDAVIAASQTLGKRLAESGAQAELLTHGVDLDHWRLSTLQRASDSVPIGAPQKPRTLKRAQPPHLHTPHFLFWGLIDARLDTTWCLALAQAAQAQGGTLTLLGPHQRPPRELFNVPGLDVPGPASYTDLPAFAADADVLVMPYADLPVTHAMQPLKLLEYLATGKPAVVRALPATLPWADAADVVDNMKDFIRIALDRARTGLPPAQAAARERLADESWSNKASRFMHLVTGDDNL